MSRLIARLLLLALPALAGTGCTPLPGVRGTSPEEVEITQYDCPVVGDRVKVGNAEPISLGGVGLVEGLDGTGGDCPHDSYRALLYETLKKAGVDRVEKLLKSPDCALVIVEAKLPPGASKGEKIDVEVKLPPGSKATSLRGGVLRQCNLFNYDFARNLSTNYQGGQNLVMGHKRGVAAGPVLVGTGEGDDARVKSGRIWSGAKLLADNPLALVMNGDSQQGTLTNLICERLNLMFPSGGRDALRDKTAYTKDNVVVSLRVPTQYRHNIPRYLRVVMHVPLTDAVDRASGDKKSYRKQVSGELLDPAKAVVAALRLEALGQPSVPTLKAALSSPNKLVRFCAAEALAYLGSAACADELSKAAVTSPMLRAYALTALGSLDEAVCRMKLRELAAGDHDAETRYGAFQAMRLCGENDPVTRGELLNDSFHLHRVGPNSKPLVHVSTQTRAEIVLFGESPQFKPPFSLLAGEFAVTASAGDERCIVSRVVSSERKLTESCPLDVEAVLKTVAGQGGTYGEVLTLLQQAGSVEAVSCRIRVDAVPASTSVHELAQAGRDGTDLGGEPAPSKARP